MPARQDRNNRRLLSVLSSETTRTAAVACARFSTRTREGIGSFGIRNPYRQKQLQLRVFFSLSDAFFAAYIARSYLLDLAMSELQLINSS